MTQTQNTQTEVAKLLERAADLLHVENHGEMNAHDLDRLRAAVQLQEAAAAHLREAVTRARGMRHTWEEIGVQLGTSRQAAQQRFSA